MSPREYLTVQEALTAVLDAIPTLPAEKISLSDGLGRVLAEPIIAQDSLPPFANSSMDGYAIRAEDVALATADTPVSLQVVGDIAAGHAETVHITPHTAARIMTGAPLPDGANAVIPVEDTNEGWRGRERPLPDQITIYRAVKPGDYVRQPGEDITAGQTILPIGHLLRPQEIGVLASLGKSELTVIRRPKVAILATGDELVAVETQLTAGKIRNSNGYTQAAQVEALGAIPIPLGIATDSEADVRAKLQAGLAAGVDLFVSSAGVSVGAYDVVKAVLEQDGEVLFWRVRMRPGKPLMFARYGGVPYLGLPGNPVSAMVSFERFARPAILQMSGRQPADRPTLAVTLQDEIESDGRESYVRAVVERVGDQYVATTTGSQGSHMMTSLVKANALLIVPEGVVQVAAGEQLRAWMLDWPETLF